jgi:hypothetical protein
MFNVAEAERLIATYFSFIAHQIPEQSITGLAHFLHEKHRKVHVCKTEAIQLLKAVMFTGRPEIFVEKKTGREVKALAHYNLAHWH